MNASHPPAASDRPLDRDRFDVGTWTVTPRELILERRGRDEAPIRLQQKEMQLLLALAEQGGRALDAETLRGAVWGDRAVSDGVVKNLVWRLRSRLGESADAPELIETVPGVGYRLTSPPRPLAEPAPSVEAERLSDQDASDRRSSSRESANPSDRPPSERPPNREREARDASAPRGRFGLVAGLLGVVAAGLVTLSLAGFQSAELPTASEVNPLFAGPREPARPAVVPRLVVDLPGPESEIALDVSGRYLLFGREAEGGGRSLYVLDLDDPSEIPVRLTDEPGVRDGPSAWSLDGRRIAFAREVGESLYEIRVMAATGGPSRSIVRLESKFAPRLAWHRESSLVLSRQAEDDFGLIGLSLTDGSIRQLTSPRHPELHADPAPSPDGRSIAFLSMSAASAKIQLLDLESGEIRSLSRGMVGIRDPSWSPAGDRLLFVGSDGGAWTLWEIAVDSADLEPSPAHLGAMDLTEVAVSPSGVMAYRQSQMGGDVIRFEDFRRTADGRLEARRTAESIQWTDRLVTAPVSHPHLDRSVFLSDRSGSVDLWLTVGEEPPIRLPVEGTSWFSRPRWSPDGSSLVLSLLRDDQFDLAILRIDAESASRLRVDFLTETPEFLEFLPVWREDGLAIHYARRSTQPEEPLSLWEQELWRSSSPRQLAENVGAYQRVDADRVVIQRESDVLELVDTRGLPGLDALRDPARFELLPIELGPFDWGNWQAMESGVLWTHLEGRSLRYYDFATGRSSEVAALEFPSALAALEGVDGREAIHLARIVRQESRLWVLEPGS